MKLPIPVFNDKEGHLKSIRMKIRERDIQEALKGIDLQEVYKKLIKQTDNMTPLTIDELKKIENQWVFVRNIAPGEEYLFLMFKGADLTPNHKALLFYFGMSNPAKLIDGKLEPTRVNDWQFSKDNHFKYYEPLYETIVEWSDFYLVRPYGMPSFMNWDESPLN